MRKELNKGDETLSADLMRAAKGSGWKNIIVVALYLAISVFNVFFISIIQKTVNNLPNVGLGNMLPEIFTVVGLILALCVLNSLFYWQIMQVGYDCVIRFLKTSFRRTLLNKKAIKDIPAGDLVSIGTNSAIYVSFSFAQFVLSVIMVSIAGAFQAGVLLVKSWAVMLAVVCIMLLLILIYNLALKQITVNSGKRSKVGIKFEGCSLSAFSVAEESFDLGCENYQINKFENATKKLFLSGRKLFIWQSVLSGIQFLLKNLVPIIALCMVAILFIDKNLLVGDVFFIYTLASSLIGTSGLLLEECDIYSNVKGSKESMAPVWRNEEEKGLDLNDSISTIKININGFTYESASDIILLKDFKAEINRGEFVLINGESGSGKSTLFKFLSLEEILSEKNGEILLNNKKISLYNKSSVYSKMLPLPQKGFIFSDTFFNNLCLGEDYSSELISEVINVCKLSDFEKEFSLNFFLEENGTNISEGQAQRICLARMLLRKPEVLLLDEPTSALDKETADSLVQNLKEFIKKYNLTAVMISHKPSDAKFADRAIEVKRVKCEVSNG